MPPVRFRTFGKPCAAQERRGLRAPHARLALGDDGQRSGRARRSAAAARRAESAPIRECGRSGIPAARARRGRRARRRDRVRPSARAMISGIAALPWRPAAGTGSGACGATPQNWS